MNKILVALLILFITTISLAEDCPTKLYNPPEGSSKNNMFFIEKNNNKNTVYYDLNLNNDDLINGKRPLNVYWKMFAKNGEQEPLSFIEKKLAFGIINIKQLVKGHEYEAKIVSMDRDINISYENGCGEVTTDINGEDARLEKIVLELKGPVYFPKLLYMDIYGQNLKTGKPVKERWFNNKK